MLFSIVTVTLNAEAVLKETIDSVLNQDNADYEYLIIDGESTDQTLDIAHSYEAVFAEKKINYKVISQKDTGIYNAMNHSLQYISGQYILFMNSGDIFAKNDILSKIKDVIVKNPADIFYGDTVFRNDIEDRYIKAKEPETICYKMPFCHQSVFAASEWIKKYKFDEKYSVCADYNLFVACYLKKASFIYVDFLISVVSTNGYSMRLDNTVYWKERLDIIRKNNLLSDDELKKLYRESKKDIRKHKYARILKSSLPLFMLKPLRRMHALLDSAK